MPHGMFPKSIWFLSQIHAVESPQRAFGKGRRHWWLDEQIVTLQPTFRLFFYSETFVAWLGLGVSSCILLHLAEPFRSEEKQRRPQSLLPHTSWVHI